MISLLLDAIVIILIILAFFIGSKRGLIKSVWKVLALVVTVALVMVLRTPTVNFLADTPVSDRVFNAVTEKLTAKDEDSLQEEQKLPETEEELAEDAGVPSSLMSEFMQLADFEKIQKNIELGIENSVNAVIESASRSVTMIILNIIAAVGLFLLIRLLMEILFCVLKKVTSLPLIGQANALLGGALGIVNVLAVIYILCALASLWAPLNNQISETINQTTLVKFFYNYNILLKLIMKN